MNRRLLLACSAFVLFATGVDAQLLRDVKELEHVNVDEHLDAQLPLESEFLDDRGKRVRLQQFFNGTLPVVLTLNYSNCPMLCGLKLRGMVEALREMSLEPGRDYQIVSVSIDPLETPVRARLAKQNYLRDFGRGNGEGWHFLTGTEPQIRSVANAAGFNYQYVPERREYAHAAVFMICTPTGKMSRYLYGVRFEPKTVQLSLVEAAQGRIGTTVDKILLFCFHYDAESGNYAPAAVNLMKFGGTATILALMTFLVPWRRFVSKSPLLKTATESLP